MPSLPVRPAHRGCFRIGDKRLAAKEKQGAADGATSPAKTRRGKRPADAHVGSALRSVWDETLGEQVPPDMMDLLGKLN